MAKKDLPDPTAVVATIEGEALTRLAVVERSRKALKLLVPLAALAEELGRLDSLDRELVVADARNRQAEAEAAELLAARLAEIEAAEKRRDAVLADAKAAAERIVAEAQRQLADAGRRAEGIVAAAVQRAGEVGGSAEKVAKEAAALVAAAADEERAVRLRIEALTAEAGSLEGRVAKAQRSIAKMLGQD